jgi:hypothetical protein
LTGGCKSPKVLTPREAFYLNNPKAREHYMELNETSIETIRRCIEETHFGRLSLLKSVRQNMRVADPEAYFTEVEKRLKDDYEGKMEFVKEIERDCSPGRDVVFYYSYHGPNGQEQGWMIVRNGQVRKKYPLATAILDAMK